MSKLEKLKEFLKSRIDLDFNFEDDGNFGDSYSYGLECGEEYAFREILVKVNELLKESNDE